VASAAFGDISVQLWDRTLKTRIRSANRILGSTIGPDDRAARRFRLSYHLVEPTVLAVDIIIVVAVSLLAGIGYHLAFRGFLPANTIQTYAAVGVLTFTNVSAVLAARGDYRVSNLVSFYRQARDIAIIWTCVFLVLIGVAFLLKAAEDFSRGATLTFFVFGLGGLVLWRGLIAQFLGHALSTGAFAPRNVILIGERSRLAASPTIFEIRRCGYTPIKTFEIGQEEFVASKVSRGLRATVDGAIEASRAHSIAEILLLIGWEHSGTIERIAKMLSVLPIPIYLLPDENVARYLDHRAINVGTTWAAEIQRAPLTRTEQFFKRCFDAAAAASALLLVSPLMLLTALLIKLDSHGPVLFFQNRNGFNGRSFRIVKFRTMHVLEDGNSIRQATRADPRVTKLGRWLRRTNIDELPQLFNVLSGDMSLVGPRPHAIAHDSEYEKLIANYAFRNHVKPGITGWAQVNGYRGETPTTDLMAKRVELDLWYINNWSMWLDIAVLFRTLILGLQPTAY
jgi:undecaprenyl-phosphate galactose phosphotransferase/putative colanic acid biosynthesis UDP-glucose lipid carrier transferase